ncbi:MAG: NmrA family NAD(P)-binding protein [Parvibaculaceae bacterium]|nr:NmrA family NAD(P)-binding protein [Parvibaculaceae bacterium]
MNPGDKKEKFMETRIVTVVGASGTLGAEIVRALLEKGAQVRAMVRATSDRTKLESLGVTDFVVADLRDPGSLQRAMTAEPRAVAVVASAAGFSAHTARTKGDNSRTDTEGYRNLVDAARNAGMPRVVLISILECDKAPGVPHFSQKFVTEKYLAEKGQPYLALRAGAFLDRARDVVAQRVRKGVFPDIAPGVALDMIYSPDLARYAAAAALDLPASALNQSVDIRCNVPATGPMVAAAFTRVLGRPVVAKPVLPPLFVALFPLAGWLVPRLRDQIKALAWIRKGGYVSHEGNKQRDLFGELPTVEDSVARYCRDKGLI